VFTSVMAIGGLATLGIIDFDGTTKASVMETPKIVAVNTSPVVSPTKNTPEIIPPVLTASGVTTQTGASTSTGQTFYPPIVVTSSGTSMVVGGTGSLIVPPK